MKKQLSSLLFIAAAGVGLLVLPVRLSAALVASDNAGNYSTWSSGDNLGTGFGAWTLGTTSGDTGQNGHFLSSSGDIDIGGQSWGLYANSSQTADAIRPLTGGVLNAGQSIQFLFDNSGIQTGGTVGMGLLNSSDIARFEFYFVGGQSNYKIKVGSETDTGVSWTSSGLSIAFNQAGNDNFSVNVTPLGGMTTTLNGTLAASDITKIRFFNFNAGSGPENNFFFNDIQVVPEPTTLALLVFGGCLALVGTLRHLRIASKLKLDSRCR